MEGIKMIRKNHINKLVLDLYKQLSTIQFPISMNSIFQLISNSKHMSYQKFANLNNCSIQDVITLCQSKSGCTHYDVSTKRYLVLLNLAEHNPNYGRQRWTAAHEVGHIVCKHHLISAIDQIAENDFFKIDNPEYEAEADYFAATLLSPFPLFEELKIKSPIDVQNVFGLSVEASLYRYKEYLQWKGHHLKGAWENDMVRIYKHKNILHK